MKRLWRKILNVGIAPDLHEGEVKFVRLTNRFAVVVGISLLTMVPLFIPYLPSSRYLILLLTSFPVLLLFCLYLIAIKAYLASKLYLAYACLVCNCLCALQMGREAENHVMLLNLSLGAFYIFPPKQFKYVILVSLSALASMIATVFDRSARDCRGAHGVL